MRRRSEEAETKKTDGEVQVGRCMCQIVQFAHAAVVLAVMIGQVQLHRTDAAALNLKKYEMSEQ